MRSVASADPVKINDVAALLADSYGICGNLARLPGENINYLVTTDDDEWFVFKLAGEA